MDADSSFRLQQIIHNIMVGGSPTSGLAQTMHFQSARDTLPLSSVPEISTLPLLQLDYAQTM